MFQYKPFHYVFFSPYLKDEDALFYLIYPSKNDLNMIIMWEICESFMFRCWASTCKDMSERRDLKTRHLERPMSPLWMVSWCVDENSMLGLWSEGTLKSEIVSSQYISRILWSALSNASLSAVLRQLGSEADKMMVKLMVTIRKNRIVCI